MKGIERKKKGLGQPRSGSHFRISDHVGRSTVQLSNFSCGVNFQPKNMKVIESHAVIIPSRLEKQHILTPQKSALRNGNMAGYCSAPMTSPGLVSGSPKCGFRIKNQVLIASWSHRHSITGRIQNHFCLSRPVLSIACFKDF